ncbi:hypothetical protein [Pseudarthrobacter sp. H2]|uniref:hypothetical protein n=1 Tax=Pseudarthrobacter sp. H2 TaxID=3418415 RepID=UPI003CF67D85
MVLSSPARLPPAAKKHAQDRNPTQVMRPKGVLNWVHRPARMPAVMPMVTRGFMGFLAVKNTSLDFLSRTEVHGGTVLALWSRTLPPSALRG